MSIHRAFYLNRTLASQLRFSFISTVLGAYLEVDTSSCCRNTPEEPFRNSIQQEFYRENENEFSENVRKTREGNDDGSLPQVTPSSWDSTEDLFLITLSSFDHQDFDFGILSQLR